MKMEMKMTMTPLKTVLSDYIYIKTARTLICEASDEPFRKIPLMFILGNGIEVYSPKTEVTMWFAFVKEEKDEEGDLLYHEFENWETNTKIIIFND